MGYIRITAGKFRLEDDNGNAAARGKVYTYTAGTSTAASSYSNKECTVANTNPIILDERGECELYTNVALKLIATDSNNVVIWTEDYQGEQEEEFIVSGNGTGDADNNYVMNVVPTFTSIPANMTIVMNPSVTNVDTLSTQSDTGVTGINDLSWEGPYTGTTTGSIFSVQIDGTKFQGTGLNDLTWTGGLAGSVHTVKISTAAATDKFQWRKNGGAWSAEISITGLLQALDSDVSVTFGAVTGHTLADLWNNKDTFQWKKDGGAWTTGVAIYPRPTIPQILQEGIGVIFAVSSSHTLNDIWSLTVITPPTLNFCSLGKKLIYKNVAGVLKALDGGDMVANIPATLVYSTTESAFILNNPSLPEITAIIPERVRKLITVEYTFLAEDNGTEIAFNGTFDANFPLLATIPNIYVWCKNIGSGAVTLKVDPTAPPQELIYRPFDNTGATSYILTSGCSIMFQLNGVDCHILSETSPQHAYYKYTANDNIIWPYGIGSSVVYITLCGGGGGGGGGSNVVGSTGGGGGGAGGLIVRKKVTPTAGATDAITVGQGGAGGATGSPASNGVNGTDSSVGALATGPGGIKGMGGPTSTGGTPGNRSGDAGADGITAYGGAGGYNKPAAAYGADTYGKGGNGGDVGASGTAGGNGFVIVEW